MRQSTKWLLGVGCLGLVAVWASSGMQSTGLKVVFCDVGQGDAAIVRWQESEILIDGGPGDRVLECLDKHLPLFDKTIEMAVVTNPDKDHLEGMIHVLERYSVKYFMTVPVGKETEVYKELVKMIEREVNQEQMTWLNAYSGQEFRVGEIRGKVIWPSKEFLAERLADQSSQLPSKVLGLKYQNEAVNDVSLAIQISFGDFDVLFNGDTGEDVQDEEMATGLAPQGVEVMTTPHHGSKTGIWGPWLEVVSPELAVISSGKGNRYGHPAPEILKKLEKVGARILRTDEIGDVVVESDGKQYKILKSKY